MIQYSINTIICSGLLFLLYRLLLEDEKMHVFKRFFLLLAIIISLVAPLITLSFSSSPNEHVALPYITNEPVNFIVEHFPVTVKEESNNLVLFLRVIYLVGLAVALLRFVKQVAYYFRAQCKKEQLLFKQARLVLVDEQVTPHSFLNRIFLNKAAYKKGLIENEILTHELAHVKQLHSVDVLFTQLLQCIFWFNPFFMYYTKAIQLNHEFLADESACSSNDPLLYQQLLITKASGKEPFSFASRFNYLIIKKRVVMITKNPSTKILWLKKLTIVPLLIMAAFFFTKKETLAQKPEIKFKTSAPSSATNASQQLLDEYEAIINKHKKVSADGYSQYHGISEQEKERLLTIYLMMTKEQQQKQTVMFLPKGPAVKLNSRPTSTQLEEWTDANKYFVRIDGRKIKNSRLGNHQPSDFEYYTSYKPIKGATDYGKYAAQINLTTKEGYANYVLAWEKQPSYLIVFRNPRSLLRFH